MRSCQSELHERAPIERAQWENSAFDPVQTTGKGKASERGEKSVEKLASGSNNRNSKRKCASN